MTSTPAFIAAWLALSQAAPGPTPDWGEIAFGPETFDVTGAGQLDLGIIDDALNAHRRAFAQGRARLKVEVTVNAAGLVQECRFEGEGALQPAGEALCAQALQVGRFRQAPLLELDYARATYRLSVYGHAGQPVPGEAFFRMSPDYPLERRRVTFGTYPIPPEGERLSLADLNYRFMTYPREALKNAIEAEVVVAVTFDGQGKPMRCRPVRSSNTARIAYETCFEAQRSFSLKSAPDSRPYVWLTQWRLAE
ncbi:MAG: hypothetical protein KAF27_12395 [Porphyrobacter sp.]|nr:hypothetical protein [Porphyrobacter sp.]